jgi:hypothetical protein
MKIFFYILQKLIKVNNIYYPNDILNLHKMFDKTNYHNDYKNETIYIYLLMIDIYNYYNINNNTNLININTNTNTNIIDKNLFAKAKIFAINKFLNNLFFTDKIKQQIFNIYSTAQNIYLNMIKLLYYYKVTKYPFVISNDLMLNPINTDNYKYSYNTHIILENNRKYIFSMNDLINIIESALSNSFMFFPEPLKPKNPYTNSILTYAQLYNIYFKMKYSTKKISTLFHLYFIDNFNNSKFIINNEMYLRDYNIKRFVTNSPTNILVSYILNMLHNHKHTRKLQIHKDFPQNLLVTIFKPFLYYFLIVNYFIKTTEKFNDYYYILNYKLNEFYKFNTLFGRQKINLIIDKNNKIIKKEYIFNTNHIKFYDIIVNNDLPDTELDNLYLLDY